jgi:hypothetical protein
LRNTDREPTKGVDSKKVLTDHAFAAVNDTLDEWRVSGTGVPPLNDAYGRKADPPGNSPIAQLSEKMSNKKVALSASGLVEELARID